MATSTRFAVAVHALVAMAVNEGRPLPSEQLAGSASTNPSVVRRILMSLHAAGITRAQLGVGGGALLARPASEVTLLDVFRAVEPGGLVATHRTPPSETCTVGRHILPALGAVTCRAERAFEAELAAATIADVAAEVRRAATA